MSLKKEILKGTLILTVAGLVSRFLGLYNRVYLANLIGAVEVGIYQLIFPVFMVCHSICCAGIETALSKMVSALTTGRYYGTVRRVVKMGVVLSFAVTLVLSAGIYIFSEEISIYLIQEPSCAQYLKILAFVMPLASINCCLLGYFYGLKKAGVPAFSQLIEQVARVAAIYLLSVSVFTGSSATAAMAVYGMLAGEAAACIFTVAAYRLHVGAEKRRLGNTAHEKETARHRHIFQELMSHTVPLTANRFILNTLSSVEAILIPFMLRGFYGSSNTALEIFGVLTGMALPFISFPTTLTNSLAAMLLPAVSEANEKQDYGMIKRAISKSLHYCLLMGILCMAVFLLYGNMFGMIFFKSEMAGEFLTLFAYLCPFMYVSSTLASALNGMGQTKLSLVHNVIAIFIRIGFIIICIPRYGLTGYLWGLMASNLVLVLLHIFRITRKAGLQFNAFRSIILPGIFVTMAGALSMLVYRHLLNYFTLPPIFLLIASCSVICLVYFICLVYSRLVDYK